MEYNELILVDDWLELRHVRDYPGEKGFIIIARFNAALVGREMAMELARSAGYQLPATPAQFLDEVGRKDFSKWQISEG